jgi:hypothetical protein
MGETGTNGTEYGCRDRAAHDLLGKLVRSPRLVGVNANYDERRNFQPEAGFFEVISQTTAKGLRALLALLCSVLGLWEIEFEVPRQSIALRAALCGLGALLLSSAVYGSFGAFFLFFVGSFPLSLDQRY